MTRRRSLTPSQILELRAEYRPGVRGYGYASMAKRFNVGESTVRDHLKFWVAYSATIEVRV